jgi:hypothetical protein
MTGEGEYPKASGDIFYASEANSNENQNSKALLSDDTTYSTTGTGFIALRTLTFSVPTGGASDERLVSVKFEYVSGDSVNALFRINRDGIYYPTWEFLQGRAYWCGIVVPVPIKDGETLIIEGNKSGSAGAYIRNIRVYGGGYGTTCVGS